VAAAIRRLGACQVEAWQEAWRRWNITQTLGKKAGGEVEAVQSQRARRTLDLTVHKDDDAWVQ